MSDTVLINKPSLPTILRRLMAEVNINEAELARKSKIPQPTLHRILTGATHSPRGASLSPLANFFSISISQLIGDEPLPRDRIPGAFVDTVRKWSAVPVIDWEMAIRWSKLRNELQKKRWEQWTTTDQPTTNSTFALILNGDTMAPQFTEGTILIVEPNAELRNRDFVIVKRKDQTVATIRQLFLDGSDRYLRTINPVFETYPCSKDDLIIGVVIQARYDYSRQAETS